MKLGSCPIVPIFERLWLRFPTQLKPCVSVTTPGLLGPVFSGRFQTGNLAALARIRRGRAMAQTR